MRHVQSYFQETELDEEKLQYIMGLAADYVLNLIIACAKRVGNIEHEYDDFNSFLSDEVIAQSSHTVRYIVGRLASLKVEEKKEKTILKALRTYHLTTQVSPSADGLSPRSLYNRPS